MADEIEFREDPITYTTLVGLAAALGEEIEASGLDMPAFLAPLPGAEVAYDYCGEGNCGGQAWTRLGNVYPTKDFPQLDDESKRGGTNLGYEIEVGIVRCAPTSKSRRGDPVGADEQLDAVRQVTADMAAMRRAICSYLRAQKLDFVLGIYVPAGPDGGCVGGTWTVNVLWERK